MPNRQFHSYFVEHWPVFVALILSVFLHILLLGYVNFDLSVFAPKEDIVEVRFSNLVNIAPPEPVPDELVPQEPLVLEPVEPETVKTEVVPVEPEVVPEPVSTSVVDQVAEPDIAAGSGTELMESLPRPDPVAQIASDGEMPVLDETQPKALSFVETEFDILRGIDGNKIGQTRIYFESKEDGTYLLESESEAKGIASLFISGRLIQRSEGLVTERGLRPSSFLYQFGGESKAQRALFDWDNAKVRLETSKGQQTVLLPKDTQDLISFMYQFMFVPPLQEMQLNITNGKRLKAYGYSFIGEEELSTKIGNVRTMHLQNINDDGDEKNEIWLAVDYRFLPVKIRKTEEDGSVIEQVMTNMKTDILQ